MFHFYCVYCEDYGKLYKEDDEIVKRIWIIFPFIIILISIHIGIYYSQRY
jgi:hypothetical protein